MYIRVFNYRNCSLQVESLKVQLTAANREKCQSDTTISSLSTEIDRKVFHPAFHRIIF